MDASSPIATWDSHPLRLAARAPPVTLPLLASAPPCLFEVLDVLLRPSLDALEVERHPAALRRGIRPLWFLDRTLFVIRAGQGGMGRGT